MNRRGLPVWVGGSDGESDGRYICERTTSCTRTAGDTLKLMDDTERARALARTYSIYVHNVRSGEPDRPSYCNERAVGLLLINLLRVTSPSHH